MIEPKKDKTKLKRIKADNCPHCQGTYYWKYSDGKECIRCKTFFKT